MGNRLLDLAAHLTGEDRTVVFPKAYVEWLDGDYIAAVVLNDAVHLTAWSEREGRGGWFWRTEGDWGEKRHLTRKQVVRAVTAINSRAGCDLVERDLRKVNGAPAMHFRVNAEAFEIFMEGVSILPFGQNPIVPKGKNHSAQTAKSLLAETETETENRDLGPSDGCAESPAAADQKPSSVAASQNAQPATGGTAPVRENNHNRGRSDGDVYALVDAYAKAKGIKPHDVKGRQRKQAFDSFKDFPAWVTPDDVAGCVAYLLSDPFWREAGRLTTRNLPEKLLEWAALNRPEAMVPKEVRGGRKVGGYSSEELLASAFEDFQNGVEA